MALPNEVIAKLLREMSIEAERLSLEQLDMFSKGELELKFVLATRPQRKQQKDYVLREEATRDEGDQSNEIDVANVIDHITRCSNRDEAKLYIDKVGHTKKRLGHILKVLDISVTNSDNKDSMVEKLLDSTIGVRLRSEAIQSLGSGKEPR